MMSDYPFGKDTERPFRVEKRDQHWYAITADRSYTLDPFALELYRELLRLNQLSADLDANLINAFAEERSKLQSNLTALTAREAELVRALDDAVSLAYALQTCGKCSTLARLNLAA